MRMSSVANLVAKNIKSGQENPWKMPIARQQNKKRKERQQFTSNQYFLWHVKPSN